MYTAQETFGISGPGLVTEMQADPGANPSPVATTRAQNGPPLNPIKAMLDPQGSAIFWIALAAILGLVMVHGETSIATKLSLGGRAGKK